MWGQPPSAVHAERSSAALFRFCRSVGIWRALLASTAGGGCPHMFSGDFGQVFPEELPSIDHLAATHVKQIHCHHAVLVVIAENVGIIAFGGGDALALLQLLHCGNQIAITRGALVLLRGCRL